MTKCLYLANPYGFSTQQKEVLIPPIRRQLESLGATVWEPFDVTIGTDFGNPGWAFGVGQSCRKGVLETDAIFAVVNGCPPDEGVMIELGMAIALGKPTFIFRDDMRRCTDSEHYPLNTMVFTGLPEVGWQDFFYTNIEEITHPDKALARWLREPAS